MSVSWFGARHGRLSFLEIVAEEKRRTAGVQLLRKRVSLNCAIFLGISENRPALAKSHRFQCGVC